MLFKQGSSRTVEISAVVIISALLSQFFVTVLFFTVPLYILYYNRGSRDFLIGTAIVGFLILLFSILKTSAQEDASLRKALVIVEIILPVILMLGMFFVIDIFPVLSGLRRLYRLFIATLAAVIIIFPLASMLINNDVYVKTVEEQMNALTEAFFINQNSSFEGEVAKSFFMGDDFFEYVKGFYLRSLAAIYFVLLLSVSRMADIFLARRGKMKLLMLVDFKVPEIFLWPALLAAVGMLVEVFNLISLGFFSAILWNCGLILLFIYGLQGLAILRTLFAKSKLPLSLRFMFEFMVLMLLFVPGANYIVIIGLPVLGVSETWINLRKSIRSTDREDYT